MKNSALPFWLTLAVVLAALYGGFKWYQVENARPTGGITSVDLPPLEDFELTDQDGNPIRSGELRGKVWVVSFFYSTCPSSCARLNANIKYLTTLEELDDVTWVSITVDPETDTQQVLKDYATLLNANLDRWHFCRHPDFDYVKRLADEVLRVGGVNYKGHNDYVVVIDRNGEIAGLFNGFNQDDLMKGATLLEQLLNEPVDDTAQSSEAT